MPTFTPGLYTTGGTYVPTGNQSYIWNTWTPTTTTNATTAYYSPNLTDIVWNAWNDPVTNTINGGTITMYPQVPQFTAEEREAERAEAVARNERFLAEQEERNRKATAARERAEETLRLLLTDSQWEEYEATKQFVLRVASGNRYLIRHGVSGNVRLLDEHADAVEALCAHPTMVVHDDNGAYQGQLPVADVLVAQVLALRADEESFRRIANITDYRRTRPAQRQDIAA
jgi:hypothetical protein